MRVDRLRCCRAAIAAAVFVLVSLSRAAAQTMPQGPNEWLCDASYQNCRTPLVNLIRNETVGIDVAFWFMQDARYETEILNRWRAGVPVRVLVDPKANPSYDGNAQVLADLAAAGIPMRMRASKAPGILHWKMMLFAGQQQVEFSGANYSPTAFVPQTPYVDYEDETIYFTDDPSVVQSFMTKYDDLWTDRAYYKDYANITSPPARIYPIYAKDPALNFPQQEDYAVRLLNKYPKEKQRVDVIMYRITDERETNAMISLVQRGIPVRILSDTWEYRNVTRLWVSYNLDKLWAAGVPVRVRGHAGLNHQKLVLFYDNGSTTSSSPLTVFGSSNWTTPSANQQQEHNYFTTKPWIFSYFVDQFMRKWCSGTWAAGMPDECASHQNPVGSIESTDFVPLPPDKPTYLAPAAGDVGQSISMALKWDGGPWAHIYDVYFGTDPNPPLFAANLKLGPTEPGGPTQKFVLPLLQHGTTYYWRVVSKTMAGMTAKGATVSFTTGGTPPPPPYSLDASTVVIWTATDVAAGDIVGNWQWMADGTAAGGQALWNPDRGQSTVSPPLATPVNYFEATFTAKAGVAYHLWLRLRAQANSMSNNSVSVQFDGAVDQYGSVLYEIGSPTGAEVVLSDPSGTLNGWGWVDNRATTPGTLIYFAASGPQRLRVQQRRDGAIVDQIVLSPDVFVSTAPGGTLNDATVYGSTIDGAAPPAGTPPLPPAPAIPAAWTEQDIGAVGMPGYGEFDYAQSVFTVAGAGADVWGRADALHYVYHPLSGDGTIVARVTSVQNTNAKVKAGVMIRQTVDPGSPQAFMMVSSSKGSAFQRRLTQGGASASTTGLTSSVAPLYVRLDRAGNTLTAFQSVDGVTWRLVGSDTIAMPTEVLVGLGVSSHTTDAVSAVTFDRVMLNGVPVTGSCSFSVSPGTQSMGSDAASVMVNIIGNGNCPWTAAANDSWLSVAGGGTGSGTAIVTVAANAGSARIGTATIAGQTLTIAQAAAPPAVCGYTISPTSSTVAAAAAAGTVSVTTTDPSCAWSASSGAAWITIPPGGGSGAGNAAVAFNVAANSGAARSGTLTIAGQAYTITQAASSPAALPLGWSNQDVGAVGRPGTSTYDGTTSTFSVKGAGADVWGTADAFQYAYRTITGDGTVVARVAAVPGTNSWVKAGVMMRETLDPGSAHAFMLVSFSNGLEFQWRPVAGGATLGTAGATAAAPYWVKIDRAGDVFTASQSPDGTTWTVVGTVSIPMTATISVGLAMSSHSATIAAASTFDNVLVTTPPPLCSYSISPGSHSYVAAGGTDSVAVTTAGSCSWIATSNAPWIRVTGGASGNGSGMVTVTVEANNGEPRTGTLTIAGQTFTVWQNSAPCSFTISPMSQMMDSGAASMSVAVVANRSTCAWTAASNEASWLTVTSGASGTGNGLVVLAAAANNGPARTGTATIAGQTFTASQAATLWSNQDIGAVGVSGATTFDNPSPGVITVTGAGADVAGTSDALQYAYQTLTGDGTIIARVASVQNTNAWTKTGVMIRESVDPGAAHAFMLISFSRGSMFQRRAAAGGTTATTTGSTIVAAPYWVRLDRVGNTITASQSPDGTAWSVVDVDTLVMPSTVLVGLAVSSHTTTATATAAFDHVTIAAGTPASVPGSLPNGWTQQDVGAVGRDGAGWFAASSGTFTVEGGGADIWGSADAFHYVYCPMTGDGAIVARVAAVSNTQAWVKAGVMIRDSVDPGSAQGLMLQSYSKGAAFQRRTVTGGLSTSTTGALVAAPNWLKLERLGDTFNAYSSPDGATWTLVGTDSITMGATVTAGLAVSGHTTATRATATFDHVSIIAR